MRIALAFCLVFLSVAAAPNKAAPHKPPRPPLEVLFAQSGSASIDLLMARGTAALAGGDSGTAKKLFDSVTDLAPNFAEGWHEKAQLQVDAGDDEGAMISLQKTVTLNPCQFAAMSELGDMLEDYGNKDGALKMYKRALALDPQLEGAAKRVRTLDRAVEGQGI